MKKTAFKLLLISVLSVCLILSLPAASASADNDIIYTAGNDIGNVLLAQMETPVKNCTLVSGALARGMRVTWNENNVYLSGIPETTGDYCPQYTVETEGGNFSMQFSFTVKNAVEPTIVPTSAPTPANNQIRITKQPTGETVQAGESAKFVARAENATKIVWKLVSPDTTNTIDCASASGEFPGLGVDGLGTDTLVLSNIPAALDKWCVECRFFNDSEGPVCSNGARLSVISNTPAATASPKPAATSAPAASEGSNESGSGANDSLIYLKTANIVNNPHSAEIKSGESCVLSVDATSPNNGTLSYQWYSAATNNRNAALPIGGASDEVYTVNQTDGTAFYWVAVWNTKDGRRSDPVYSEAAEVRIKSDAEPTPTPTATPEAVPESSSSGLFNGNFQLILFGIIGILALAALVGVVIYLRIEAKREEKDNDRS